MAKNNKKEEQVKKNDENVVKKEETIAKKEETVAKKEDSLKIRPMGDKVLVKRLEAEEKTAGGIVLPEAAKEKPKEGKVVEVGIGKLLDNGTRANFTVKKDDRIIFSSYAGTEIKIDGVEYLILSEDEILAIVR